MKHYSLYSIPFLLFFAYSCNSTVSEIEPKDNNTLHQVVRDNFGLQFLATSLHKTGISKTLIEAGPFTLLASSDQAFKDAGYKDPAAVYMEDASKLELITKYHILKSELIISKVKMGYNQPLETLLGTEAYLSKVLYGKDTMLTINGSIVLQLDTKASNGMMQVINNLLLPNAHKNLLDGLSAISDLSLFYQALKSSGITEQWKPNEKFTIYAPNNIAMRNAGYSSLEQIVETPKEKLIDLVEWHICKDQKFKQDYQFLATEGKDIYSEKSLNNKDIPISIQNHWRDRRIVDKLSMRIGSQYIQPTKYDIITGTGIIHIIGRTFN
ncbi:hypothetical protein GCM10022216_14150 [Sphingobacterium kyonggiense]|uniref:FAS1 domain-containing protein n=1 Tax=Sphingobacterium kyonggiense TaxID=714075 RepID=A0ABP7YLC2_9SPHI